mgnify:CR=1 FL=1
MFMHSPSQDQLSCSQRNQHPSPSFSGIDALIDRNFKYLSISGRASLHQAANTHSCRDTFSRLGLKESIPHQTPLKAAYHIERVILHVSRHVRIMRSRTGFHCRGRLTCIF